MQRLTANKLDFRLPNMPRLTNVGMTSIILRENAMLARIYTIEAAKLEYWRWLGIIDHFTDVGMAKFSGWRSNKLVKEEMVVWMAKVPILAAPPAEQRKRIRSAVKRADRAWRTSLDNIDAWDKLHHIQLYKRAANFAFHYDPESLIPDMQVNGFRLWQDKIVCIDPYCSRQVAKVINLTRSRYG